MKIGTLTTHMSDNYGAVLQAYALSTYIGQQAECEIVNYYPDYLRAAYHGRIKISDAKSLINFCFQALYAGARKRRSRRFAAFREQHMRLSYLCRTRKELTGAAPQYEAIVAGSDQIWNPDIHGFDENFFLTFCPQKVRKYGYAPSFGVSSLNAEQAAEVSRRCEGFTKLAFREESGVRIAKEVLGLSCPQVLDPVFLLSAEHWRGLKAATAPTGKYVLCYFLSDPRGSVDAMCKRFQKEGYAVYSIGFSARDMVNGAKKVYDLGPSEFLAYIDHADYILTDSFHATAFSILFGKNFYTRTDGKNAKRADRVVSLLKACGLEERTYADADASSLSFTPIDEEAVAACLADSIADSRSYVDGIVEECSQTV
ncbi:MAG: polysaccharide pyruvyl transferase family protein [Clostridia bacterium]|nr:polysaccharide pyruvyl transferase family protein [Clostridia bacterium]